MIKFIRSGEAARGKQNEAMAWGKQIAEYMNQTFPEGAVQVFVGRFGQLGRIQWHLEFDNLAALDAYVQRVQGDQGYQEQVEGGTDLFVEGSFHDDVLMEI